MLETLVAAFARITSMLHEHKVGLSFSDSLIPSHPQRLFATCRPPRRRTKCVYFWIHADADDAFLERPWSFGYEDKWDSFMRRWVSRRYQAPKYRPRFFSSVPPRAFFGVESPSRFLHIRRNRDAPDLWGYVNSSRLARVKARASRAVDAMRQAVHLSM